jgi:hypothetical protein
MPGTVLFLFVSGGVGAMALGLWIVLRRSRARSLLVLATAHSARQATDKLLAYHDERRASPEPAGTVARGGLDDNTELGDATPAQTNPGKLDGSNAGGHLAPPLAASPADAAQPPEIGAEDVPVPAAPHGDDGARETETVATPEAPSGAAEILAGLEPESEAPTSSEAVRAPPPEDGPEESPGLATPAGGCDQPIPASNESAGAERLTNEGPDSYESPLPLPPEEMPLAQEEGDLADAIGEADGAASVASASPGEVLAASDAPGGAPGPKHRESEEPHAEERTQASGSCSTELPLEPAAIADDLTLEAIETDSAALLPTEAEQPSEPEEEASAEVVPVSRPRPSKPAQHRDRRGQRRPAQPKTATPNEASPMPAAVLRTPAEARLRLIIHPVRRTVAISAVLARPAGYPDSITLSLGAETEVGAYGDARYDDVDLEWTPDLLSGEVRLDSREGYQWLRSGRRIHIFSEQADEQGLISVGSAPLNSSSAVVCIQDDVEAVRSAAAACGSPGLVSHDRWSGVPEGWAVLSGYRPAHAASALLDLHLTTLDPGVGAEIRLSGGLEVRSGSFAQDCPPRIEIQPFPAGAQVTIDGMPAEMSNDGCWRAAGWDRPGDHLIDVVPGPSLTYRIVGDPWTEGGWESWDAHAGRFQPPNDAPWARAQICGASVLGPSGEHIVAAEPMSSVIALGLRRGVAMLRARPDAPVAVGLLREPPAFLISSSGPRRTQGRVDWLVPPTGKQLSRLIDLFWVAVVRSAASRRLPLSADSPTGQEAWRRARARARRHRKAGA